MTSSIERMDRATTGGLLEVEMFGERFKTKRGERSEYLEFEDAVEQVKADYPGDSSDPRPRFANNLHYEVAQEIGLSDRELSDLRFYTAVGSALDHYHGVDAFFEYNGRRVTLDVTKNPAKAEGYKADLMLGPEEQEYEIRRQELASDIADRLR